MAAYSVQKRTHQTLGASTVDTVTLTGRNSSVEILNRDSSSTIYFTVDGTTPTVAGNETIVLPPGAAYQWLAPVGMVKLISSGTPAYSVQGVP